MMTKSKNASNLGYKQLEDERGRPMQMRREIRSRISCTPGTRRQVYRRVIRNIIWREGIARWFYEDIEIEFKAYGYAKFPEDVEVGMVAFETANGIAVGWVRVDPHSVRFEMNNG